MRWLVVKGCVNKPQELGLYPMESVVPGSSIHPTWELVRNAHSRALPHVYGIRTSGGRAQQSCLTVSSTSKLENHRCKPWDSLKRF